MGKSKKHREAARAALAARRSGQLPSLGRMVSILSAFINQLEMNQIARQVATDATVRRRMEKLLQCTEAQLNECEYSQGVAWLDTYFGKEDAEGYQVLRRKVEGSPAFWAWWKNQWRRLDAQLSPNLRAVELCGEWVLGYYPPNNPPHYYSQTALDAWRNYYQSRHALDMTHLRPDEDMMRRILTAA